jgi:hypothetical protein
MIMKKIIKDELILGCLGHERRERPFLEVGYEEHI